MAQSDQQCSIIGTNMFIPKTLIFIYIYFYTNFLFFLHYVCTFKRRSQKSQSPQVFNSWVPLQMEANGFDIRYKRVVHTQNMSPNSVSIFKEGLHWKWLWAGKGGNRRSGWEAGSELRSGITASHWSCQACSTQRCRICVGHSGRRVHSIRQLKMKLFHKLF